MDVERSVDTDGFGVFQIKAKNMPIATFAFSTEELALDNEITLPTEEQAKCLTDIVLDLMKKKLVKRCTKLS